MRLTCPQCGTEYDVPDEAVAERARTLRCSFCGHQWRHGGLVVQAAAETMAPTSQDPAPDAASAVVDIAPAAGAEPIADAPPLLAEPPAQPSTTLAESDSLFRPRAAPPPRPRHRAPLAVLAVLLVAGIVALAAHRPIARAWPPSAKVYQALGLK